MRKKGEATSSDRSGVEEEEAPGNDQNSEEEEGEASGKDQNSEGEEGELSSKHEEQPSNANEEGEDLPTNQEGETPENLPTNEEEWSSDSEDDDLQQLVQTLQSFVEEASYVDICCVGVCCVDCRLLC